jgi:hypothetical protein
MLNLPVPRTLSVAVGIKKVGPAPQIGFPGFAGDRKNEGLISFRPKVPWFWLRDVGLKDKRSDGAGDEVPVFAQLDRDDWLKLDHRVAISIEWADIEIGNVLERNAD